MTSLSLPSPAKLNLYLKTLRQRPDGFHDLVTLFERIDLADEITLKSNRTGAIRIRCADKDVPTDSRNLAHKAARMLREDFALKNGADITIRKRIPVAAGLGGGSSNAAAALLGLDRIWKLTLSRRQLLAYARKLGSDVPFFIYDCSWAVGTGRGDRVRPLKLPTKLWHVLVTPKVKLYAGKVYGGLNLGLTKKGDNVNILIQVLRRSDLSGISRLVRNDLEHSIRRLSPNLSALEQRMNRVNPLAVSFSGSGPTLFGLAGSRQEAEEMRTIFAKRYRRVFVTRTL